ncbi:uncharacterized protein LOC117175234 [Belonocnema kinseyi]|uniref:uncharacterized protein LOC117175234 n=1 Tax=Belonocnema kinseyi TaxID=2817044 RepID=UPI00143D7421|nr:uncharacterized protein LOC117175234 [Belonocnema kinseyi]
MNRQGVPEPPNAVIFLNRNKHFVGQIAKTGSTINIITPGGWTIASRNQRVIYERLRKRRPADPREYRIPPVTYRQWDQLIRNGVQIGVVVKDHDDGDIRMAKFPDTSQNARPRHGDELHRMTGWDDEKDEAIHSHFATYWRDMWLVLSLLPQNAEERRLASRLDSEWLQNQHPNRGPHH